MINPRPSRWTGDRDEKARRTVVETLRSLALSLRFEARVSPNAGVDPFLTELILADLRLAQWMLVGNPPEKIIKSMIHRLEQTGTAPACRTVASWLTAVALEVELTYREN